MNLQKAVVRRLRRLTPMKTNHYLDIFPYLLGDVVAAINSIEICVNLRIGLRFLG